MMLSGIQVVVIGGDARQLQVIRRLAEINAKVTLIGFDQLQLSDAGLSLQSLTPEALRNADVVVLPIVGTDDDGFVQSVYSEQSVRLLDEHMASLPKHAVVYTGMARNYLECLVAKHDIQLVKLLDRDDVAIYNSIPSAEGALMMAIQNTDITIHGSQCMVLGFGRTGMTLARTLQAIGAKVKIGTRREDHIARAYEMGFTPFAIAELAGHVADVDILFNTIPAMVVTKEIISKMYRSAIIIDLASSPGGTDFSFAEKFGIKALLAPGLPGIVAPKTAGRIIADTLSRLVLEQRGNREESE